MAENVKYSLRKDVLGKVPEVQITHQLFEELKTAREILTNAFEIEEKYELLTLNYLDFERQLLDIALTSMVRRHVEYYDFFIARSTVNVRLLNFLTTARLFLDSLQRNVEVCCGDKEKAKKKIKEMRKNEFETNSEYRFMESLRNYVQHFNLPVDWIQYNNRRTSTDEEWRLEFSTEVACMKANLEEDGNFKKKVLDELGDKIDLKVAVKSYTESLSIINSSVRELIHTEVCKARKTIESALNQYAEVNNGDSFGLCAAKWQGAALVEAAVLTLEWDDIRIKLQMRNKKAVNLKKRYVTGFINSVTTK